MNATSPNKINTIQPNNFFGGGRGCIRPTLWFTLPQLFSVTNKFFDQKSYFEQYFFDNIFLTKIYFWPKKCEKSAEKKCRKCKNFGKILLRFWKYFAKSYHFYAGLGLLGILYFKACTIKNGQLGAKVLKGGMGGVGVRRGCAQSSSLWVFF